MSTNFTKIKPKLSKGILEMKFMQRTKEKVAKEDEIAEERKMYSQEITNEMLNGKSNFIIEPSFFLCENLKDGRLSFRGMNPELERLMELEDMAKETEQNGKMETDVKDKEMVEIYDNNVEQTIKKKFQTKKRRSEEISTDKLLNEGDEIKKKKKFAKRKHT